MRTEDDLRQALLDLEPANPHIPDLLDRVEAAAARRRRRRATTAALATVVAVGGVGAVTPLALRHADRASDPTATASTPRPSGTTPAPTVPPPTTPNGWLRFVASSDPVSGYVVSWYAVVPGGQTAVVDERADSPKDLGDIRVYAAGRYDPAAASAGVPLQVRGHQGYFATLIDPDTTDKAGGNGHAKPAVVWEYAPDSWAVVQGDWTPAAARTEELRIANAVRFDRPQRFAVPYRAGFVPAGLVVGGGDITPQPGGWYSTVLFTTAGTELATTVTASINPPLSIDVHRKNEGDAAGLAPTPRAGQVHGHPAYAENGWLIVDYGSYVVSVQAGYGYERTYPLPVLRKVAEDLTFAPDVNNPTTWYDGATAFPS
jgi:hypothetical protein